MAEINFELKKDLEKFGAKGYEACYNCGTCTAICDLSDADNSFPRKMIRYSTLGLEDEIETSLDPWLCYYCGDCSSSCPRKAEPASLMMSLRRWLIAKYDWTGLSGLLYKNTSAYIIGFLIIIGAIIALYSNNIFTHSEWLHYGHLFEMTAIISIFAFILLPNIIRMWNFTVLKKDKKFVIKHYFNALPDLFLHMFTQKRSLDCEKERRDKVWYFEHLMLVFSYLSLLFITVVLNWLDNPSQILNIFGYTISGIIFIVTIDFIIRRFRQRTQKSKFSHPSDWFFVIWLSLMGITIFISKILIDTNNIENHFYVYLAHLTVLIQWALIIVPFGKWTHFLYRSFAMYFEKVNSLFAKASKK